MSTEREKDRDSLIALAMNGGRFLGYSVRLLLDLYQCYSETHYWMLYSALNRQDKRTARIYLGDWSGRRERTARVSKFVPGDHYHALGEKFGTLAEAIQHLETCGYRFGGLHESYFYDRPE